MQMTVRTITEAVLRATMNMELSRVRATQTTTTTEMTAVSGQRLVLAFVGRHELTVTNT